MMYSHRPVSKWHFLSNDFIYFLGPTKPVLLLLTEVQSPLYQLTTPPTWVSNSIISIASD